VDTRVFDPTSKHISTNSSKVSNFGHEEATMAVPMSPSALRSNQIAQKSRNTYDRSNSKLLMWLYENHNHVINPAFIEARADEEEVTYAHVPVSLTVADKRGVLS
jgi:hypothetical protein